MKTLVHSILLFSLLCLWYNVATANTLWEETISKEELTSISHDSHFNTILLIVQVNFNPPLSVLQSHEDLWRPFIRNTVYYGPFDNETMNKMKRHGIHFIRRSDVEAGGHGEGDFQYQSAVDAMTRFPYYEGYLFKHDDFHLDINSLRSWDLSTIWITEGYVITSATPKGWQWDQMCGYPATRRIAHDISREIPEKILACTGSFDKWWSGATRSDFFYIPATAVDRFVEYGSYFYKQRLYIEVAIPTIFNCLMGTDIKIEKRRLCNMWEKTFRGEGFDFAFSSCQDYPTTHNIKLSKGQKEIDAVKHFMYGRNFSDIVQEE